MHSKFNLENRALLRNLNEKDHGHVAYTTLPEFAHWWASMGAQNCQTAKHKITKGWDDLFDENAKNVPVKFKMHVAPVHASTVLQLWARTIFISRTLHAPNAPDVELKAKIPVLAASLAISINVKHHPGIEEVTSKQIENQECDAVKGVFARILKTVELDRFDNNIFKVSDVIVVNSNNSTFLEFAITAELDCYPRNTPNVVAADALWKLFDYMKEHGLFEKYKFYSVGVSCHAITDDILRIPHIVGGFETHELLYGSWATVEVLSPSLVVEKGNYPSFRLGHRRGLHIRYDESIIQSRPSFALETLRHGQFNDILPHVVLLEHAVENRSLKGNVIAEDGTRFNMPTYAFTIG